MTMRTRGPGRRGPVGCGAARCWASYAPTVGLVGRDHEVARLHALLDDIDRRGASLVLTGDPGIGKTALLAEATEAARASDLLVLNTAGIEAETHLPYAALHKLLWPVRKMLHDLPDSQVRALNSALGLGMAEAPTSYLVALAVMNLLAEVAESTPLVLVADDAQWLDPETGEVLAFLARRIEAEPVVLLAAARDGMPCQLIDAGLPTLAIAPLSNDSAESLLSRHAQELPPWLRRRILQEASGNPLALIELPTVAALKAPGPLGAPWLPLAGRLEDAYAARAARLSVRTQAILQVAAVDDGSALDEVLHVASRLVGADVRMDDLQPAADARLVSWEGGSLTFHHPLVRSAIYQGMTEERRRAVHRALAERLGAASDRGTWHSASAISGHDEAAAAALQHLAARARQLGHVETAVRALERASQLSPDPRVRADRLLSAADSAVELGQPETVARLLDAVAELDLDSQQRARVAWISAAFDDGLRDPVFDAFRLAELAESVNADGHTDVAIRILWSAALRCFWTEPGAAARARIVEVAEALPVDPMNPRLLAILGYAAPVLRADVVIERMERLLDGRALDSESVRLLGSVAVLVGRLDIAVTQSAAAVTGLREEGRLQLLARALAAQAWAAAQDGQIGVAMPVAQESAMLAGETGQPFLRALMLATRAKVAALQGDAGQADALASEAERIAIPAGARNVLATAQHARALVALGAGDYAQALSRLLRMHEPASESHQLALKYYTLTDIADAAHHSRKTGHALSVLAELERDAALTPSDSLHDSIRLARALLGEADEAEARFLTALAVDLSRRPFTRARTELAYGEWLRRQRRTAESRDHLRSARETFDALGTTPFGDRARRELRAAGERSPERQRLATDILTPQELQVAQLAADGLTNKQIGSRLYVSHRTVGAHLARIYAKLGVTSRVQLHAAIRQ